jgi:hypothetical protein
LRNVQQVVIRICTRSWGQRLQSWKQIKQILFHPLISSLCIFVPSLFASKLFQVTKGHPTYNAKAQTKENSEANKKNNPHHEHISNNRPSAHILQHFYYKT